MQFDVEAFLYTNISYINITCAHFKSESEKVITALTFIAIYEVHQIVLAVIFFAFVFRVLGSSWMMLLHFGKLNFPEG